MLRLSDEGLELIKQCERFEPRLYNCPAGHATIGYGHLVHYGPVGVGDPKFLTREEALALEVPFQQGLTEPQALALLRQDLEFYEDAVHLLVHVPLDQAEYDALIDLTYNIGTSAFTHSTLLRKLNLQDYDGAAAEFGRWVRANGQRLAGLVKRRKREEALFRRELPREPVAS